jgi:hypothetical protein
MSALRIRLTKRRDGTVVARFERPDGSATWERKDARYASFFARHDLTHYAVETTMGYRRGFYGLVAEGWDLSDFGSPWPRGRLPADAEPAELIVGFFDGERADGVELSAADFNRNAALSFAQRGYANPPTLDDATLARIRAAVKGLTQRWDELPLGATLELDFALPVSP